MNLDKKEILAKLCSMTSFVAERKFNWSKATDCFCHKSSAPDNHFQFESAVLEFIEAAIKEKLERETKNLSENALVGILLNPNG